MQGGGGGGGGGGWGKYGISWARRCVRACLTITDSMQDETEMNKRRMGTAWHRS